MQGEFVIQTRGLSKVYKGVTALDGLDLAVPRNSIVGFLGPNGAGKSTTIKLLLGLIRPTAGSASLFGLDSVRESVAIRRRVGYLSQDPRFYDHLTARETLRFTARFFYEGPAGAIEERVNEVLDLVGLREKADRPIKGFSGGERQRLGIAQAQINHPDLLILDEPAASLDPMGRRDVLEVMARLRKHCTIFYSTHILEDVQRVSDMVAILNGGRLVAQAPIQELLAGNGKAVYTVALKGDAEPVRQLLSQQAWVDEVDLRFDGTSTRLHVTAANEEAAEAHLLRLVLSDPHTVVTEFGRKKYALEEVFVSMVGGEQHGR